MSTKTVTTRDPFPHTLRVIEGRPLPHLELNLARAARLLEMDYAALRGILRRTNAPPELRRRRDLPHWRLDARSLFVHLRKHKPDLAARLAEKLKRLR